MVDFDTEKKSHKKTEAVKINESEELFKALSLGIKDYFQKSGTNREYILLCVFFNQKVTNKSSEKTTTIFCSESQKSGIYEEAVTRTSEVRRRTLSDLTS